jgi:hypothetical protein
LSWEVAVGTRIAPRPPRRSGHAAFPHPAPVSGRTRSAFGVLGTHAAPIRGLAASSDMPVPALCPRHASQLTLPSTGRLPFTVSAADVTRHCSRLHRYYAAVRLLIRVHAHRSALAFMSRPGMPVRARVRSPRFRTKDVATCMGSPTARGSSSPSHSGGRMLPSRLRTGSAPRNSTRFAARYPAHGRPCERFKLSLAVSPCITRGRGGWLGLIP